MQGRATITVLVALAVLLAAAGAAAAFPAYAPEVGNATGPSSQQAAHASAMFSAWEDDAGGDWDIVVGVTDTGLMATYPNVTFPSGGDQRAPVVSDEYVVYQDDRGGDWDLYARLASGVLGIIGVPDERALVTGAGDQTDPAISGQTVVYVDDSRGNPDIAVHYIDTGESAYLTTNAAAQAAPAVDGRWVVWSDRRNGNWDIYAYDLTRRLLKRLTTSKADQVAPQVGQNRVVYQDRRNGNWDVYQYDLKTGKERRLTTGASDQTQPNVDAHAFVDRPGNVVYVDDRRDGGDIYLRDGATGIVKPVCTAAGAQTGPSIDEEHVAWTDARATQADVYSCTLRYPHMSIKAGSATPPYNAYGSVTGSVVGAAGTGVVGGPVYAVRAGTTFKTILRGSVGAASGTFSVLVGRLQRKATVSVTYRGSASSLPVKGGTVVIKPQAGLSRPWARYPKPTSVNGSIPMTDHSRMIVSGTLRPHHAAGSKAVTLMLYKLHSVYGWQLDRRVGVAVHGAGATSTYETTLRVDDGYGVRYKVQAWHSDADHGETLSAFSAVLRP